MTNDLLPHNAALLLEGGALRGLYTCGVLDIFMEQGIYFPTVAGVSAGALGMLNYLSRQPGRGASVNLRYRHDPRYFGPAAAVKGSLFGLNFLVNEVQKEVPYDQETFDAAPQRVVAVATSLRTGRARYFEKGKTPDFGQAVMASASMPLISVPVQIGEDRYLDGGTACPIPLHWALHQKYDKIVVVTTRHKGFRKEMPSQRTIDMYTDFYAGHVRYLASLLTQEIRYNRLMDDLDELESAGRVFAIRPSEPVTIGRFEGDTEKLLALYNAGRRDTRNTLEALRAYLEN